MKIGMPDSFYFRIIGEIASKNEDFKAYFEPSAVLAGKISSGELDAAFIPSLYLLQNEEVLVSSKIGLSFEGFASQSFMKFTKLEEGEKADISVAGDQSIQEPLIVEIILHELYGIESRFHLKSVKDALKDDNAVLTGDAALNAEYHEQGLSLSEELYEISELPYLNFVLAAKDAEKGKLVEKYFAERAEQFYEMIEGENEFGLDEKNRSFMRENVQGTVIDLDEADIEGLNNLLRMIFYKGLSQDIRELKFFEGE